MWNGDVEPSVPLKGSSVREESRSESRQFVPDRNRFRLVRKTFMRLLHEGLFSCEGGVNRRNRICTVQHVATIS